MAFVNPNKLTGLSVVSGLGAVRFIGGGRMYSIPTSDSTYNYFPGDLVAFTGAGDVNGLPNVAMCAAGATGVGVIQAIGTQATGGPYINPNNLASIYAPLTKAAPYYAFIADDPMTLFEIQEVGTGTSLTATCVGANANLLLDATATGTPLATQAFSRTGITDTAAPTTTSSLNFQIISFAQRIDNHFVVGTGGGYQKWWVRINNHAYSSGVTAA
jgi:hypothetical protein